MSLKAPPMLVTVMGGYAKGDVLTPLAQRWIKALRLISSKLIWYLTKIILIHCLNIVTILKMLRSLLSIMAPMTLAPIGVALHLLNSVDG